VKPYIAIAVCRYYGGHRLLFSDNFGSFFRLVRLRGLFVGFACPSPIANPSFLPTRCKGGERAARPWRTSGAAGGAGGRAARRGALAGDWAVGGERPGGAGGGAGWLVNGWAARVGGSRLKTGRGWGWPVCPFRQPAGDAPPARLSDAPPSRLRPRPYTETRPRASRGAFLTTNCSAAPRSPKSRHHRRQEHHFRWVLMDLIGSAACTLQVNLFLSYNLFLS
jgi:hypothetical protein